MVGLWRLFASCTRNPFDAPLRWWQGREHSLVLAGRRCQQTTNEYNARWCWVHPRHGYFNKIIYVVIHVRTLQCMTWHDMTLHYMTLHYIHYMTLHYITFHLHLHLHLHLHYITYITLRYVTLDYITLRYITLHYTTWDDITYIYNYIYIYC